MVPNNIIRPFAEGNMVQLIVLAVLVGVACGACRIKIVSSVFDELNRLFMKIIGLFINLLPVFIFCSISSMIIMTGSKGLLSVLGIFCTAVSADLALALFFFIILFAKGFNPFLVLKKSMQMLITAFTTSSSIASMPDTMVLSLANIYGIEMPFAKVLSLILSTVILVLAMPGIPGVSIIILSSLLIMSGCPVDALGMVIGIDPIVDMLATPIGVFGVLVLVLVVAKSEKMLNK